MVSVLERYGDHAMGDADGERHLHQIEEDAVVVHGPAGLELERHAVVLAVGVDVE